MSYASVVIGSHEYAGMVHVAMLPSVPAGARLAVAAEYRIVTLRKQGDAKVKRESREVRVMPSAAVAEALFVKDPAAAKDYWFDWSEVLEYGETIATSSWSGGGLTVTGGEILGAKTGVKVSGGVDGSVYVVTNAVSTSLDRAYYRQFRISVQPT